MATAVLRLAYLRAPLTADEGGLLMVARQWHPGTSLYGDYWVDRPPLLIALARVADLGGGLTALRLLGCLAAGLTVLGVALAVRRVGPPSAVGWSAAVTGGLLVSPLVGATPVNGELLAAPFIAVGVWLSVVAVAERVPWAAAAAGACAVAAVLVKQNMLDVAVFAVVLGVVSRHTGQLSWVALRRLSGWFGAGGLAAAALVLEAAWLAGTTPGGVLFAMYPFRWRAMSVVQHHGLAERIGRLVALGNAELVSLGALLLAALVALLLTNRFRGRPALPLAMATLAVAAYDVVSVVAGGSYWLHYLVQLAVPTGLAAGLVVGRLPRPGTQLAAVVLAVASVGSVVGLGHRVAAPGVVIGTSLGRSAEPGDTAVSLLGDPDILESAGLPSPYPYLWSLPARTLDPGFHQLADILTGSRAPTWLVLRGQTTRSTLDHAATRGVLESRYHLAAQICGRDIYLRSGAQRPLPRQLGSCSRSLSGWSTPFDALTEEVIP